MNTKVAIVLFGCLAVATASYVRHRAPVSASADVAEAEHEVVKQEVKTATYSRPAAAEEYSYTPSSHRASSRLEDEKLAEEQAKHAKYDFALAFDDGIMDSSQVRQESRDGLKVVGSYSYSDGYVKRTVKYEADENGYRVLSTDEEPIGNGPQIDLANGKADVHTQVEGIDTQYSITAHDIALVSKDGKVKIAV